EFRRVLFRSRVRGAAARRPRAAARARQDGRANRRRSAAARPPRGRTSAAAAPATPLPRAVPRTTAPPCPRPRTPAGTTPRPRHRPPAAAGRYRRGRLEILLPQITLMKKGWSAVANACEVFPAGVGGGEVGPDAGERGGAGGGGGAVAVVEGGVAHGFGEAGALGLEPFAARGQFFQFALFPPRRFPLRRRLRRRWRLARA